MSEFDAIHEKLDQILALLTVTPSEEDDDDEMVPEKTYTSSPPVAPSCAHRAQAIRAGKLVCANCGFEFGATGIGAHVAGSGTREGRR